MPVVQLDNLPLYYQDIGDGDDVLLALHPSTVSTTLFQWALPKNDRFRVLLPDQRGHGQTPNPAPNMHMTRLIDDMLDFLDALNVEAFHAIGYSMGAAVLLGMATQIPDRFKSLIVIGANHTPPTDEQFTHLAGPIEDRKGIVLEVLHPERGIGVGWEYDLGDLARLTCPVNLIAGDRDPVNRLEDVLELYRALPNGRLLVVPECAHFGFHTNPLVLQQLKMLYDDN
jgi:3-oxoadipate enol-lactonase